MTGGTEGVGGRHPERNPMLSNPQSMCGADCWTDHRLLVSKLNLTVQPQQRPQGPKLPKTLNVAKLHNQETKEAMQSQLREGLGDLSVDVSDIGGSSHNFSNIVFSVSNS